jgi:hypothetical protein
MTACPTHLRTAPCGSCSADHLAGDHPNRDHATTCPRCATPPAQIDAAMRAAADTTLTETEGDPR